MRNSNKVNRSTEQTPSECKHYLPAYGCVRFTKCLNDGVCPCALKDKRAKGYCPDYEPKEKKDGSN